MTDVTLNNRFEDLLPSFAKRLLATEFIKYAIAGAIAFVCDFAVLALATEFLGLHYLLSNVGGYATGLVVSYYLNVRFVFRNRRYEEQQGTEFAAFALIVIVGLAISNLSLFLIAELGDVYYLWAKVLSVAFVFLFNFVAKKVLLFPSKRGA